MKGTLNVRKKFLTCVAATLLLLTPSYAPAQRKNATPPVPRAADGKPDLTGVWQPASDRVGTWAEANQNFFAALKLEKLTMFVILTLIILVASLNIISTLVVMVMEKTKDIGILKAIGMSSAQVRRIFTYQGLLIGTLGISLGTCLGIAICSLLKKYQFVKLPQDIYYLDRLPVSLAWSDIVLIIAAALGITLISTIYPAMKAASLRPVEALRYE